jgi:hypothetical protein
MDWNRIDHIHNSGTMAISKVTQIRTSHVFFSIMARLHRNGKFRT